MKTEISVGHKKEREAPRQTCTVVDRPERSCIICFFWTHTIN